MSFALSQRLPATLAPAVGLVFSTCLPAAHADDLALELPATNVTGKQSACLLYTSPSPRD